ncbi:hypothetical protein CU661_16225, partial [Pseudomonas syringae pv. actinidifoliorum]|nr:hypothetical protein [Pseudomonas syringae pv. actinidifoliorum]
MGEHGRDKKPHRQTERNPLCANLFAMGCEAAKAGHLGCIWCTEAAGFAAGSRQFADKSAPTKTEIPQTSEASLGPHTYR